MDRVEQKVGIFTYTPSKQTNLQGRERPQNTTTFYILDCIHRNQSMIRIIYL